MVLRLVCAFCAFGISDLALKGIKHLLVRMVPPGSGSLPGLSAFHGSTTTRIGGETWQVWFLVATCVLFLGEAALLVWALRAERRQRFPVVWVVFGGVGLLLRPFNMYLGFTLALAVSHRGTEQLAALAMANQLSSTVAQVLHWLLWGALLVYLAIRYGAAPQR